MTLWLLIKLHEIKQTYILRMAYTCLIVYRLFAVSSLNTNELHTVQHLTAFGSRSIMVINKSSLFVSSKNIIWCLALG